MSTDRRELLEFALQLARAAEPAILSHYQNCEVSLKPDGTEVTEADRGAEQLIRGKVAERFPEHGILGEEFGNERLNARHVWVIDPVDGTASFTLGLPLFGTLIALLENGDPVLGVVHLPALGETIYASKGAGCWLRRGDAAPVELHVDPCQSVGDAVIASTGPHASDIQPTEGRPPYRLTRVIAQSRKFRFGGDCVMHALVARGRLHAAIDTIMAPWDIAALVPCIEEAGGVITALNGRRENILFEGSLISSSHPDLHRQLLAMLDPQEAA
ncbi:MAG: inositol monophosphatase family protein [bacterium]|nr:inositol monophosphatase family protein [bacterium]